MKFAEENPGWGYDRIAGALSNLGYTVSDQTVGNILKRNGIPPSPERHQNITWASFIRKHQHIIAACDLFTTEVITPSGLVTYYVLFFIHLGTRKVHIAGITPHPDESWMKQIARNITMDGWEFLEDCRYLIHDRDTKFCRSFCSIIRSSGVEPLKLPYRSPNLNAFAERWVLSIKSECISGLIFFGEESLSRAINEYTDHYHQERNHQSKDNRLLFPSQDSSPNKKGNAIACWSRLGGVLKYYYQRAA